MRLERGFSALQLRILLQSNFLPIQSSPSNHRQDSKTVNKFEMDSFVKVFKVRVGSANGQTIVSKLSSPRLCKRCRNMCSTRSGLNALENGGYEHSSWQQHEAQASVGCPMCQMVLDHVRPSRRGYGKTSSHAIMSHNRISDELLSLVSNANSKDSA